MDGFNEKPELFCHTCTDSKAFYMVLRAKKKKKIENMQN
jgi:hypothetical protein